MEPIIYQGQLLASAHVFKNNDKHTKEDYKSLQHCGFYPTVQKLGTILVPSHSVLVVDVRFHWDW